MALMPAKTYTSFKAAGVSEGEAIAAAEELAVYENRFNSIEGRLDGLGVRLGHVEDRLDRIVSRLDRIDGRVAVVETEVAALAGKITVLTWAVGINAAGTIAILGILVRGH